MTDTIERPKLKITYATLRADNEELNEQFEKGLERARAELGKHYPNYINGEPRHGEGECEDSSPIDENLVLGYFARGTRQDAKDAIAAARAAFPGWRDTPWQERVKIMRRAGELISERQMELAGLMVLEVGKNRLEALGDVLFQSQQYARASAAYERFVRLDDRSARVDYKLALARYRDGDADGAIAALKDTLRLDEGLADAQYLIGVCQREQGNVADALKALEKAVALSPGLVPARRA